VKSEITETSRSGPAAVHSGFRQLFRNRPFMCLWLAQIFSQFSDRAVFVLFVAVLTAQNSMTVLNHVVGAAQMTSWLYVAFTIPAVILSPVAGVYVDRWSNKAVLIVSNLARAFCVALIMVPWIASAPKLCLLLAFFLSIGSQFFGPAETASIPRLVEKKDLYHANSLFFTTMMIALGFGFAVGEPIIATTGVGRAPLAVAGGFCFAALMLLGIKDNKPAQETRDPWFEELRTGIAYIVDSRPVFRAIFKITLLFSTIITLNIIAVGLAEQVMHIQPSKFGYIVAAAGLGMGIGNFWVTRIGHHVQGTLLSYSGFCGLGFFMSLLGLIGFIREYSMEYNFLWPVSPEVFFVLVPLVLAILMGVSCAFVAVPTQAALQAAVPENLRGKVFGAQITAMSAASTIPVILAGISTDNLPGGVSTTLLLIGVPTLLGAAYQLGRQDHHVH
jgi:MFS family permease